MPEQTMNAGRFLRTLEAWHSDRGQDRPTIIVFLSHQSARGTCEQCGHYGPVSLWQTTAADDHNATLCPPCYGTHLDDARRRYTVRFE